jgi:hypothetical protein
MQRNSRHFAESVFRKLQLHIHPPSGKAGWAFRKHGKLRLRSGCTTADKNQEESKTCLKESRKTIVSTFPLRVMPSERRRAEILSDEEGVSLNQFINYVAVADKVAHLETPGMGSKSKTAKKELAARALKLLEKARQAPAEAADEFSASSTRTRRS